ncbi:Uncharacterized protein ToN1_29660 [Aromatoleum petrolei]|nr:Uncharacterized protein ToN1_29660 [Aromatoleum petrolei]
MHFFFTRRDDGKPGAMTGAGELHATPPSQRAQIRKINAL